MRECQLDVCRKLEPIMELAKVGGWWIPYKNVCILQHRHTILHRDEQDRLHNPSGQAVGYRDGWGVFAWHGVRVPEQVIMAPETLEVKQIENEANAEIRRVMIERYGQEKFLLESGARVIQSDDFGILYRKEISGDEPLVMVKIVNSTPEPDGRFKDYFLRVPSDMQTAREAVAWTFDMSSDEYDPVIET